MDMSKRNLCVLLGICFQVLTSAAQHFETVYAWNRLEFDYATPAARQADINSGFYVVGAGAPIDVDVYYARTGNHHKPPHQHGKKINITERFCGTDDNSAKLFVTVPRFIEGIPVTLGTISGRTYNGNPVVTPFPDWSWQRNIKAPCNANRIISVFRIKIDECGRLWVMDAGKIGDNFFCPPQLLAFDLTAPNTPLILKYDLPASQFESRSVFVTPIVDVVNTANRCKKTFVYMADCQAFSIVVYDQEKNRSWRIIDKTFYPFPTFGTFRIEGDQFDLMDGILGMDLEAKYRGMIDRKLFYNALASNTENWVYTSYLKNESRFASDPTSSPQIFNTYTTTRTSQSAAFAVDTNGVAYFGNMDDTTMMCWNTRVPYSPKLIEKNKVTLQFPSGVKVITNLYKRQEVWIMTNSFQKVVADTLSPSLPNFRILAGYTDELLSGPTARQCAYGAK